jgi:hypothetical protein
MAAAAPTPQPKRGPLAPIIDAIRVDNRSLLLETLRHDPRFPDDDNQQQQQQQQHRGGADSAAGAVNNGNTNRPLQEQQLIFGSATLRRTLLRQVVARRTVSSNNKKRKKQNTNYTMVEEEEEMMSDLNEELLDGATFGEVLFACAAFVAGGGVWLRSRDDVHKLQVQIWGMLMQSVLLTAHLSSFSAMMYHHLQDRAVNDAS